MERDGHTIDARTSKTRENHIFKCSLALNVRNDIK